MIMSSDGAGNEKFGATTRTEIDDTVEKAKKDKKTSKNPIKNI